MKGPTAVLARVGRVLVVDDDPAIRSMISYVLAQVSLDVIVACDGPTALGLMQAESVDLALIDYHMPGMTGIELAAIIQEHQPSLPLALMTARVSSV